MVTLASAATGSFLGVNVTFALDWTLRRGADTFCPLNEQQGKHHGRELPDVGSHGRTSRLQRSLQPQTFPFTVVIQIFTFITMMSLFLQGRKKCAKNCCSLHFPAPRSSRARKRRERGVPRHYGRFSVLIGCFCSS